MLSQCCLKLTIGNVHNLLLYKNEKKVAEEIEKPKNKPRLKFAVLLMKREIMFNFEK